MREIANSKPCCTAAGRKQTGRVALALAFGFMAALRAFACGPFFPNLLLNQGDAAVLTAPEARFQMELERMNLVKSAFRARLATNYAQQTFDAELTDLRAALERNGVSPKQREAIVESHRLEREKIIIFSRAEREGSDDATTRRWLREGFVLRPDPTNFARISGPMPQITTGLPGEFADYFRGSVTWHLGKMTDARAAWTALLARPVSERHFKSTWAAFMLGKSWEEEDTRKAIPYFQQARALAKAGFADSLGLAASSLGWEARLHLREKDFAPAIDLYLEHAACGDPAAVVSLRWAASAALRAPEGQLRRLAGHPRAQRVITAYVISGGWREAPMDVDSAVREGMIRALGAASARAPVLPKPKPEWHKLKEPALRWLEAVEAARVKDVDSAEQLALAAYQGGQMERAARWLKLARATPVAQWLQAKLLLRDGQAGEAAAVLARLVRLFPLDPTLTNRAALPGLAASLYVPNEREYPPISVTAQWHGEWGVFRLARRQYSEALDALLRSGFWFDAAYVAERVLTLDELKTYVDRSWPRQEAFHRLPVMPSHEHASRTVAFRPLQRWTPEGARKQPEGCGPRGLRFMGRVHGSETKGTSHEPFNVQRSTFNATWRGNNDEISAPALRPGERIRYLLARRLARAERWSDARSYFPAEPLPAFDALYAAMTAAKNPAHSQSERAKALFDAAKITRHHGLELIGTEVEPDWHLHGGNYQYGVTVADRRSHQETNVLAAATEEIERATRHTVRPDERWHYRYRAAELAWEAARFMPDNSDDTARVLCLGGSWIKNRNPEAADVFYKALVRRCRKTALGAEADRIRWFPRLDEEGNLRPRSEQPLAPSERQQSR